MLNFYCSEVMSNLGTVTTINALLSPEFKRLVLVKIATNNLANTDSISRMATSPQVIND